MCMHFQNYDSCQNCHFIGMFSSFYSVCFEHEIPSSGPQSLRSKRDSFDDKDTATARPTYHSRWGHFVYNENFTWVMKFQ